MPLIQLLLLFKNSNIADAKWLLDGGKFEIEGSTTNIYENELVYSDCW